MNCFKTLVPIAVTIAVAGCGGSGGRQDVTDDVHARDAADDTIVPGDSNQNDSVMHDTTVGDLNVQDQVGQDVATVDAVGQDTTQQDTVQQDAVTPDSINDAVQPVNIAINTQFSECGGFVAEGLAPKLAADEYCGDEQLVWSVDTEQGLIHFTNVDVFLNCCGVHSLTITFDDGVYVITEIDDPENGGDRCDCMCLFDFAADMPGVDADSIQVQIVRDVTDSEAQPEVVWEGAIDLTTGSGSVMIEENVGWCTEPVNIGVNGQYSACGGFTPVREASDCGTETLAWNYDSGTGTLSFLNTDVWLNCCGEHSMSVFLIDDVYVLAEVDAPAAEGGRCFCDCLFDYSMDVPDTVPGVIDVSITRDATDSGQGAQTVWQGTIDLSQGSGEIVIKENVGYCA